MAALTTTNLSLQASVGIIESAMVTHPALAASTLDGIIGQPAFAAQPHAWQAQIYSMRARAELNLGDARKALPFVEKALAIDGRMGSDRVTLPEVAIRGDAALVYAMLHQPEKTREYLTFTGAGHLPDETWFKDAAADAPVCGPDMAPEDTAVVEFAIGDDGRTVGAAPVYASRPGQSGVEFARAVRAWRWRPQAVAKLNGFWRVAIRVQLRCAMRPAPLSLDEPFYQATRDWLHGKGVNGELRDLGPKSNADPLPDGPPQADVGAIPPQFRRLDAAANAFERRASAKRLDALLVQTGAPIESRALVVSQSALVEDMMLQRSSAERARMIEAALPTFDNAQGGARSGAWLRVEAAVAEETAGNFSGARTLLQAVAALPIAALGNEDPIRSVALLHLSLIDRRAGDSAGALARLNAAGLNEQKCDLLDVRPAPTSRSTNDSDFPDEAQRWGFEGWVQTGFDIGADGAVKQVRALVSYPPFVFAQSAEKVVSRFRYLPPTLGDTALGCTGQTVNVVYKLPRR